MRQHRLKIAVALTSLLLAVVLVTAWLTGLSNWAADRIRPLRVGDTEASLCIDGPTLFLVVQRRVDVDSMSPSERNAILIDYAENSVGGFAIGVGKQSSRWVGLRAGAIYRTYTIGAPILIVLAGLIGLPALEAARRMRNRKRQRQGRCLACGYDLRGASCERCPECGGSAVDAARARARAKTGNAHI